MIQVSVRVKIMMITLSNNKST